MFDFVPLKSYALYFHYLVLFLVFLAFWQCARGVVLKRDTVHFNATLGFFIASFLILYMGLRPISGYFGDTINYATQFGWIKDGTRHIEWDWKGEWLFDSLMYLNVKYGSIHLLFFISAFVYVGSLWLAMRRMFGTYYYVPFLVIISMFTFWAYGVNGVRNGAGASLFILALTYVNNIPIMIAIFFMAIGFHSSVYLMIASAILAWFIKNSYYYLAGWIVCVIISYYAGFTIQNLLAGIDFLGGDDRFSGYLTATEEIMESEGLVVSMTFRWDFIAYSALGVGVGYYFIFVRKFQDEYYHWIYNMYLATNAFWILVIRAAYSNRFAQISWFILPIVLIYPFMKQRFWLNHEKILGYALLVFYLYSFYDNIYR